MALHITKQWEEVVKTGQLPDKSKYELDQKLHKEIGKQYGLPFEPTDKTGIQMLVNVQLPEKRKLLAGVTPYRGVTKTYIDGFEKLTDDGLLNGSVYIVPGISLQKPMKSYDVRKISDKILENDRDLYEHLKQDVLANEFETTPLIIEARPDTIIAGENPHHSSVNLLLKPKDSLIRYESKIRQVLPIINNNSGMLYLINIGYVADKKSANLILDKLKREKYRVTVEGKTVENLFGVVETKKEKHIKKLEEICQILEDIPDGDWPDWINGYELSYNSCEKVTINVDLDRNLELEAQFLQRYNINPQLVEFRLGWVVEQ